MSKAKKPEAATRPQSKFNSSDVSAAENARWIEHGDMQAARELAKGVAQHLHWFVLAKPLLQAVTQYLYRPDEANLHALRKFACDGDLLGEAAVAFNLLHVLSVEESRLIRERIIRKGSSGAGKTKASGVDLFAKMLVPGKPLTKSMHERKWLASFVDRNPGETIERLAEGLNYVIAQNHQIMTDWRARKRDSLKGYHYLLPKRRISVNRLEKARREFKLEIDKANGITRKKLK